MTTAWSKHEVHTPETLEDALNFLAAHKDEGWTPIAGGTDLMVGIDHGKESRTKWLNLSKLARQLSHIQDAGDEVRISAMATMTALRNSDFIEDECPILCQAAATVGALQIQNRATVAGNICNASPAGDTLPVWLAMDAEIDLASTQGTRSVPYREFMTGYRQTVRRPDELVVAVRFKKLDLEGWRLGFRKVGTRAAQAISKVVFAGATQVNASGEFTTVRLAYGSMAATTRRATQAEQIALGQKPSLELAEKVADAVALDLTPIDDIRSTGAYRALAARNITRAFIAGQIGEKFGR